MRVPIERNIQGLQDLPHTISYVMRKRQQVDNLSELPKDKRPPDDIIWEGTTEDMEDWLDRVLGHNKKSTNTTELVITKVEG